MKRIGEFFRSFRREQSGAVMFEAIIIVPMVFSAIILTVVAYNYWHDEARDVKAGLAIADAISRETDNITPDYLDSMFEMQKFLTGHDSGLGMRVAVVRWNERRNRYRIRWQKTRKTQDVTIPRLTQARLKEAIPRLVHGETVVMAETFLKHHPMSSAPGLPTVIFNNVAVSRPRNGPQICWATDNDPASDANRC